MDAPWRPGLVPTSPLHRSLDPFLVSGRWAEVLSHVPWAATRTSHCVYARSKVYRGCSQGRGNSPSPEQWFLMWCTRKVNEIVILKSQVPSRSLESHRVWSKAQDLPPPESGAPQT